MHVLLEFVDQFIDAAIDPVLILEFLGLVHEGVKFLCESHKEHVLELAWLDRLIWAYLLQEVLKCQLTLLMCWNFWAFDPNLPFFEHSNEVVLSQLSCQYLGIDFGVLSTLWLVTLLRTLWI
jgi:hypothetical protein